MNLKRSLYLITFKQYSGSEEISYDEAIKIMDVDYGYTRSIANLSGVKDPRPWV